MAKSQNSSATKTKLKILSVKVFRELDKDPDTSYLEQDGFEDRLRQFQDGQFDYIGIGAEAEVWNPKTYVIQRVHSGSLWGIESDSAESYLKGIELEELAALKGELTALGFSKRAIAKAFQSIERKDA